MSVASIKQHFANWRQWELNPVVVKELRQAVRSWAVTGTLILFLVVLFIVSVVFLVTQTVVEGAYQELGGTLFGTFAAILTFASVVFIPLYVGVRLMMERAESNLDLLYISTLKPGRIIRGKLLCSAYMAVLFFSACMPFMAFTNLLRGVDLPTVFVILIFLYAVVCMASQVAIFLACMPVSQPLKVLIGIIAMIAVVPSIFPLVSLCFTMMRSGIGMMLTGADFWIGLTTTGTLCLAGTMMLYFLSVAMISPLSANRALPLRIYITVVWLLGALVSFSWAWHEREAEYILPWLFSTITVMALAMVVIVSNEDELSFRVRRDIPKSTAKRGLAFLFYNGAAGGLVWAALIMGTTLGVALVFMKGVPAIFSRIKGMSLESYDEFMFATVPLVCYIFAYALTALFIHRRFCKGKSPRLAGVLMVFLPGVWALLPTIVLFFLNRLASDSFHSLDLGNIFFFLMRDRTKQVYHLYFAVLWLVLMLGLNRGWFVAQVRKFKPLERGGPVPPPLPPI